MISDIAGPVPVKMSGRWLPEGGHRFSASCHPWHLPVASSLAMAWGRWRGDATSSHDLLPGIFSPHDGMVTMPGEVGNVLGKIRSESGCVHDVARRECLQECLGGFTWRSNRRALGEGQFDAMVLVASRCKNGSTDSCTDTPNALEKRPSGIFWIRKRTTFQHLSILLQRKWRARQLSSL